MNVEERMTFLCHCLQYLTSYSPMTSQERLMSGYLAKAQQAIEVKDHPI